MSTVGIRKAVYVCHLSLKYSLLKRFFDNLIFLKCQKQNYRNVVARSKLKFSVSNSFLCRYISIRDNLFSRWPCRRRERWELSQYVHRPLEYKIGTFTCNTLFYLYLFVKSTLKRQIPRLTFFRRCRFCIQCNNCLHVCE